MDMMAIDLQAANKGKKGVLTLKVRIATFEKEVAVLREESTKYWGQADKWAERYGKLTDDYQTLRTTANATPGVQNTIIQKIKPFEPKWYKGAQDLEIVTRYVDEVEHYIRRRLNVPKDIFGQPEYRHLFTFALGEDLSVVREEDEGERSGHDPTDRQRLQDQVGRFQEGLQGAVCTGGGGVCCEE